MRVLVCGSRTWTDRRTIWNYLDDLRTELGDFVLIQGKCKGADLIARDWAIARGVKYEDYPADWDRYGKRAGFIRNKQMLEEGKPDLVQAFMIGESRGTTMMIGLAAEAGVKVRIRGS